jgi:hypothetical protein
LEELPGWTLGRGGRKHFAVDCAAETVCQSLRKGSAV